MKKKSGNSEGQGGKWLATFNDMVTLLLTFFVLILSMSTMDAGKVKEISRSVKQVFGMLECGQDTGIRVFDPFVFPRGSKIVTYERRKEELANHIDEIAGMDAEVIKEGVSVTLGEKVLFETGSAEITEKDDPVLNALCTVLQKTDCKIRVEGHTDDVPINNERFPSNWELSSARAVAIVKYLISEGGISPERLSAAGYADSRPRVSNISENNRIRNRRVEIFLTLKEKQDSKEKKNG